MRCNLFFLKKILPVKISIITLVDILNLIGFESCLNIDKQMVEINISTNRTDCLSLQGLLQDVFSVREKIVKKETVQHVIRCDEKVFFTLFFFEGTREIIRFLWIPEYLSFLFVKTTSQVVTYNIFLFCLHFFGYYLQMQSEQIFLETVSSNTGKLCTINEKNGLLYKNNNKVDSLLLNNTSSGKDSPAQLGCINGLVFFNYVILQDYFDFFKCLSSTLLGNNKKTTDNTLFFNMLFLQSSIIAFNNFFNTVFSFNLAVYFNNYVDNSNYFNQFVYLRASVVEKVLSFVGYVNFVEICLLEVFSTYVKCQTGWLLLVKDCRKDLCTEGSILDVIVRFYGYHNKTLMLPNLSFNLYKRVDFGVQFFDTTLNNAFVSCGFQEVLNYSFIHTRENSFFLKNTQNKHIHLRNPLTIDMSTMRTSLLPGILSNLRRWLQKNTGDAKRYKLFEHGTCFLKNSNGCILEIPVVCGVYLGNVISTTLTVDYNVDILSFFEIKQDVACVFNVVGCKLQPSNIEYYTADTPHTTEGSFYVFRYCGVYIGNIGKVNKEILEFFSITKQVAFFNIYTQKLEKTQKLKFFKKRSYPVVCRDLSFVVPKVVTDREIYFVLENLRTSKLFKFSIYDVFSIKGEDKVLCVCLRVSLMGLARTTESVEITTCLNVVMNILHRTCDALFRFS